MQDNRLIHHFTRHWRLLKWLEIALYAFAIGWLFYSSTQQWLYSIFIFVLCFVGLVFAIKPWKYTLDRSVAYLDEKIPDAQYSSGLLLQQENQLSDLALLQYQKTLNSVRNQIKKVYPVKQVLISFFVLIAILAFGFLAHKYNILNSSLKDSKSNKENITFKTNDSITSTVAIPKIIEQNLSIKYPKYTRIGTQNSEQMNAKVLSGSTLLWEIQFDQKVDSVFLESGGKENAFIFKNKKYEFSNQVNTSSFYNLKFKKDGISYTSDLYAIEVFEDEAPVIDIKDLDQYSVFNHKGSKKLTLNAEIKDDYGIKNTYIIATVSKGTGESVKFREERLRFDNEIKSGSKRERVSKKIDLDKLGLTPGDELYFYIEAYDFKTPSPNYARSETYFASIKDTTSTQFAVEGTMGVDLMPEYFRSQRQIIIDTEKLIKQKSGISTQDFKSRSNELGYDQKVLRLKYGEFMGDEAEYGPGVAISSEAPQNTEGEETDLLEAYTHDHDHEEAHAHQEEEHNDDGKEEKEDPLAEYLHNHDDPEESTLFTQSLKSKLRQALNEMWDAELYLRLYQPEKSLPYQYRALKLIQEIKNSARIYVHRIGFDPPPIKEDKRLTGELKGIKTTTNQEIIEEDNKYAAVKETLNILNTDESIYQLNNEEITIVEQAANVLAEEALKKPGQYLETLQKLKNTIDGGSVSYQDRKQISKDLLSILPEIGNKVNVEDTQYRKIDELLLKELEFDE